MALKINPKFKELCRSLTTEEYAQLEANIVGLGRVREEILLWKNQIVDGHHRYEIATKHKVEYSTADIQFVDENAAINWIVHNQLGRRNVTPQEASYLRGKLYIAEKADQTENLKKRHESPKDQNDPSGDTAAKVAEQTGVSAPTVKRDAKKAEALDKLPEQVRDGIRSGKYKATAAAIKKAGAMSIGEIGPVARKLRVGETSSLDEAIGIKGPKADTPKTASKPPAKKGQPTVDVRKWAELETAVGKLVRLNTALKEHCKCGLDHHETIRQHFNGILNTLKEWRRECCAG